MKVLIINANENNESYSFGLRKRAENLFKSNGDEVVVSDLYQMNFNPVASENDFKRVEKSKDYKIQDAQLSAVKEGGFADDLSAEMEKLQKADLVIFNFPIWWNSMPAIMKGWIDRVFAMGFAYGGGKGIYEDGPMSGKKVLMTITTGLGEEAFGENTKNGSMDQILFHITNGMFKFVGMEILPSFIIYGASKLGDEGRETKALEYEEYLASLEEPEPVNAGVDTIILN